MHEYQIPKRSVQVRLALVGGTEKECQMFLSEFAETHRGPERPTSVLNRKQEFTPFVDDEGRGILVRTHAIEAAYVDGREESSDVAPDFDDDVVSELSVTMRVDINLESGRALSGRLEYVAPEGNRRVQDFLRQAPTFFAIQGGDKTIVVNRDRVVTIVAQPDVEDT